MTPPMTANERRRRRRAINPPRDADRAARYVALTATGGPYRQSCWYPNKTYHLWDEGTLCGVWKGVRPIGDFPRWGFKPERHIPCARCLAAAST